ncbi:MAG: DUF1837 domain-containing protein [Christensenellaceae bacterium]|jgi:hypothetical protein|nr:DUF1837 domain-containing protein [Christensenellaceae bacterium]
MPIINNHPTGEHPFSISLQSNDESTESGIAHRALAGNGNDDVLIEHMSSVLQEHHVSPDALRRHRELVDSLRIANLPPSRSLYPHNSTTQKGNFAEIFLAEYLDSTTESQLPIYRLRYNTNPEQSMKGDDVLLFDLDSDPVRIIVGESKFRGAPNKQAVIEIVDGLVQSNQAGLPVSLMFVAERLFQENKPELGVKVQECAVLFATNRLHIDYVGLLMGNHNARNPVNKHTPNRLHNLLMISLGMQNPETVVEQSFDRLEGDI